MRRYITLFIAGLLLMGMMAIPVSAETDMKGEVSGQTEEAEDETAAQNDEEARENGEYKYKLNEDGSITLLQYIGSASAVITPQEIDGKPVTVIGEDCFYRNKQLRGVQVSEGVVEIGDTAFAENGEVQNITGTGNFEVVLPKTLKKIGSEVFRNTRIVNIYFYDGLESIGDNLCSFAVKLSQIRIPDSVKNIGRMPFLGVTAGLGEAYELKIYGGEVAKQIAEEYKYGMYAGDDMKEVDISDLFEEEGNSAEEDNPATRVRQIYFDKQDTGYENVSFPVPEMESGHNWVLLAAQIVGVLLFAILLVIVYGQVRSGRFCRE